MKANHPLTSVLCAAAIATLVLALSVGLTGCDTVATRTKNKAYCSGDEMVFVSWYHRIGVAAPIDNGAEHCPARPPAQAASAAQ